MIDKNKLQEELMVKKMKLCDLPIYLGISKTALWRKITGRTEFTLAELKKIRNLIGSRKTTEIFFEN